MRANNATAASFGGQEASGVIAKLGAAFDAGLMPMWDLAPDGSRVLVATPLENAGTPKQDREVVFLENFFDELRRKAPVGK